MTQRLDARLNPHSPTVLSVFRVIFGLLFLLHGLSKLIGWPVGPQVPAGTWPFWFAGIIELVTGILITLGLFTRPAAFIACGEMAVGFFTQHLPNGFWPIANGGELAVLYCFAFLLLTFTGPGAYALDTRVGRGRAMGGRGFGGRGAAPVRRSRRGWRR
jgi:putative oxidoreductase